MKCWYWFFLLPLLLFGVLLCNLASLRHSRKISLEMLWVGYIFPQIRPAWASPVGAKRGFRDLSFGGIKDSHLSGILCRRLQKTIVCTEMRFIMRQLSAHRFYRTWLQIPHFHALKPCDVLCAITGRLYSSRSACLAHIFFLCSFIRRAQRYCVLQKHQVADLLVIFRWVAI